jgi:glycine cleavage system H protein
MVPEHLRYHKEHEWVRLEAGKAVIGISDHAQEALGDIVFFQLPKLGEKFAAGQEIGEVESTKAT